MKRWLLLIAFLAPPAWAGALGCGFSVLVVAVTGGLALLCALLACALASHRQWTDYGPAARFAVLLLLVMLYVPEACAAPASSASSAIPDNCHKLRRDLVRIAQVEMGLDAPIATLAGQLHQESRCNPRAVSPVGAQGAAQFMPATARWMQQLRRDLAGPDPFNPVWAIRAMVIYDQWLLQRVQARTHCDKWAKGLSAYNGGLGWVIKDTRLASASGADPLAWFDAVERYNSGRSSANFTENRHYPRAILFRWEPLYEREGWGPGVCA